MSRIVKTVRENITPGSPRRTYTSHVDPGYLGSPSRTTTHFERELSPKRSFHKTTTFNSEAGADCSPIKRQSITRTSVKRDLFGDEYVNSSTTQVVERKPVRTLPHVTSYHSQFVNETGNISHSKTTNIHNESLETRPQFDDDLGPRFGSKKLGYISERPIYRDDGGFRNEVATTSVTRTFHTPHKTTTVHERSTAGSSHLTAFYL